MKSQQTSMAIVPSRHKTPLLKAQHRKRLAAAVWVFRSNGGFTPDQDFRSAKTYAGVPFTCDAYLDRVEAKASMVR